MSGAEFLAASKEAVAAFAFILSKGVAVLMGVIFIIIAIHKMLEHAKGHRQGRPTFGPIVLNLAVGAIFIKLATFVDVITGSIFGSPDRQPASSVIAYMPPAVQSNQLLTQMVEAGALWVALIGLVAIMRGFVLLNEMSDGNSRGQSNGWKSFWHILFGGLAMNLGGVFEWFK